MYHDMTHVYRALQMTTISALNRQVKSLSHDTPIQNLSALISDMYFDLEVITSNSLTGACNTTWYLSLSTSDDGDHVSKSTVCSFRTSSVATSAQNITNMITERCLIPFSSYPFNTIKWVIFTGFLFSLYS